MATKENKILVDRVQTGIRIERNLLKVLKAFAEYKDMTLGDLLEGIVLHSFEGRMPFEKRSLKKIAEFSRIYGMELTSSASHKLRERKGEE